MLLFCNIFILIQISLFTEQVKTSSIVIPLLCYYTLGLKIRMSKYNTGYNNTKTLFRAICFSSLCTTV
jgi:hypothetical protein